MSGWVVTAAGAGSAAVGGVYLAFSAVVMPALARRPDDDATAIMVAINERAVRPVFMVLFFGTAVACVVTVAAAITEPGARAPSRIAGSVAYLAGWLSTMVINVPLNNRLADHRAELWPHYRRVWTRANHVRALLSLVGGVGLLLPPPP